MNDRFAPVTRAGRRAFTAVEKYAVNIPMRTLLERGLAPDALALLETTGRRSGRPRRTPIGNGLIGDTFWAIAERGLDADYVRNLQADPRIRVKADGQWRTGTAEVLPDDDVSARVQTILAARPGLSRKIDAKLLDLSVATLGTEPVTVRMDLDPS